MCSLRKRLCSGRGLVAATLGLLLATSAVQAQSDPYIRSGDLPFGINHGGGPISQDQLIDLGVIAPGSVERLIFSMDNELKVTLPLPAEPVVVEGNELTMPTAMPTELAPKARKFFAVDSTGLGDGEIVRKVSVSAGPEGQNDPFDVRIQLTVLTPSYAEQAVREVYERYQRFAAADHNAVSVTLDQFQTHYQPQLASLRYLDLFDYVQVDHLTETVAVSGHDADDAVAVTPLWRTLDSEVVAADSSRASIMDQWTVADLEANALAESFPIPELVAATTYRVQLDYDGESRTYQAAFFWTRDPGKKAFIHDRVMTGLDQIQRETRIPTTRSAVELGNEPLNRLTGSPTSGSSSILSAPSFTKNVPGAAQCHVSETQGENHNLGDSDSGGHESGRHFSSGRFDWTCKQSADCTNRCEANATSEVCWEHGEITSPPMSVVSHTVVSQATVPENRESYLAPATCGVQYGCAIGKCYGFFCIEDFEFGFQGGGVTFGLTLGVDTAVADLSWQDERTCPPPVQCDPDPTDGQTFPGGPCDGTGGPGPYQVSFTAEMKEVGSPLVGFNGSAEVTLSADPEPITVDASGTYTFEAELANGTSFDVSAVGQGNNVYCFVDNGENRVVNGAHVDDVSVLCVQLRLPEGCPQNVVDCITPPDGCYTAYRLKGFIHISTLTTTYDNFGVSNGELTYDEHVDFDNLFIPIISGRRVCPGDLRFGDPLKSSTVTDGPVLYSRNAESDPVTGEVVIWGVARDDAHGVSDVDVYLDGQPAPLTQFAFNLQNGLTCSEYSSGLPCDDESSYYGRLDTSSLSPGRHTITVNAVNSAGVGSVISHELVVAESTEPDVRLVASYVPEGSTQRSIYGSQSSSPMTPLRFEYDQSQGNFMQRPGGACGPAMDNPTYFKVRLGGDADFEIDGCQIRSSWDDQWFTCSPGVVDVVNRRDYFVLITDTHLYEPCDFNNPVAPLLGANESGWFKARFMVDGLTYERRIDFEKAP